MRKIITIASFLSALVISGCETERIIFRGPYFVRFTKTSLSQKESNTKVIRIEVNNSTPKSDEDVEINYKIGGDAREGIDYTILGDRGIVTIPAGEYFGYIEVQLINNSNNILRSQEVSFTLQTVSTSNLQVGEDQSGIGRVFTLTIVDDCILSGTYSGKNGSSSLTGLTILSADCETYTLSNWNIDVFNISTEMDLTFVDNDDNTLTIPEQEEQNISADLATIRGTGSVDPVTKIITMTITLVDFEDQPEITITLTPE